jgi:hypothetical protein
MRTSLKERLAAMEKQYDGLKASFEAREIEMQGLPTDVEYQQLQLDLGQQQVEWDGRPTHSDHAKVKYRRCASVHRLAVNHELICPRHSQRVMSQSISSRHTRLYIQLNSQDRSLEMVRLKSSWTKNGASCLRKAHASDPCLTPDLTSLQAWASSCNSLTASSGMGHRNSLRLFLPKKMERAVNDGNNPRRSD